MSGGGGKGILIQNERAGALSTLNNQSVCYGISSYDSNAMKSPNPHSGIYEADTGRTLDLNGGNPACNQGGIAVLYKTYNQISQSAAYKQDNISVSLTVCGGSYGGGSETLVTANSHPGSYTGQDAYTDMLVAGVDCRNGNERPELYPTLQAKSNGGQSLNFSGAVRQNYMVRRLTPLECERLQGFPDNWTDIGDWTDSKGKLHKAADSPRYKALGNSIALPFWQYLARRICAQYERDITMASLFDGIGGFPLVFERCGAKAVWASEIEEFPMAVTKMRFKEET